MIGELPTRLDVNGKSYAIRTDMQDVLKILQAFNDPELENEEKVYICLFILYRDFDQMPQDDYSAAYKAAVEFMDCGIHNGGQNRPSVRTMDWEQDAPLIFPPSTRLQGVRCAASRICTGGRSWAISWRSMTASSRRS